MKVKQHYAAPGADDTFLRPEKDNQWAPREISICVREDCIWMSWIHRQEGTEHPVFCCDCGASGVTLQQLEKHFSYYSKPIFIPSPQSAIPELAVFAGSENSCSLRIYDIRSAGQAVCSQELSTSCTAVYHADCLCLPDASTYILYAGIVSGKAGIKLFLRRKISGEWLPEECLEGSAEAYNRPRLSADGQGRVLAVADAYQQGKYRICWRILSETASSWQVLYEDSGWNLFPSIATDSAGCLWASWLHLDSVRREAVAGLRHQAKLANWTEQGWQVLQPEGESCAADMNLGLLPLKRYFGYDGLRRYPRVVALQGGEILLLWEQQKDEDEIWDNLHNGLLLGRVIKKNVFSPVLVLAQEDCCFSLDSHALQSGKRFLFAAKTLHQADGHDFLTRRVDLSSLSTYRPEKKLHWQDWLPYDFNVEFRRIRQSTQALAADTPLKLYWGDLHCHSVHSPDAEGEVDELYHFAKDIAGLDFVAITDNDFYPGKVLLDSEIHYIASVAKALSSEDFLALSGYEWTFHRPDANHSFNHRIVIYPENEQLSIRRNEQKGASESDFARYIKEKGYFSFPHHGGWELLADEPAVEVTSAWGTYILDADTIWKNLKQKRFFAFLGNSDSHRFMPGLSGAVTGVFAEDLSRESIFSALRQGRCFATTGNRTSALFYVNDCFLGGSAQSSSAPLLRWQVCCHEALETVKIFRDGEEVFCSVETCGEWRDAAVADGSHYYLLEVKEQGEYKRYPHNVAAAFGKYLWTSPIRFCLARC